MKATGCHFFVVPIVWLAIAGCSTDQLPVGATLTISPPVRSIAIVERRDAEDRCLFDPANYVDLPLVLSLRDAQGSPIGDSVVSVYIDFAANTFSGFPALELYDDLNDNGVVDASTELVSGEEDGVARVRTSVYAGERALLLRANLSCPYRSETFAFVDGVSASASFEVTSRLVIGPELEDLDEPGEWIDTDDLNTLAGPTVSNSGAADARVPMRRPGEGGLL